MLARIDEQSLTTGKLSMCQKPCGIGDFSRRIQSIQQIHPPAHIKLCLALIVAGQGKSGGKAIDATDGAAMRHRQHRRGSVQRRLAQRVGEEIRVEIGDLLIEQIDDAAVGI